MRDNMDFILSARQLRGARNFLGTTLIELAEKLDVSKATVSNWEKDGYVIPTQRNSQLINYFKKKGVAFVPGGAFVITNEANEIQILKGYEGLKGLFTDVYEYYQENPNAECFVFRGVGKGLFSVY